MVRVWTAGDGAERSAFRQEFDCMTPSDTPDDSRLANPVPRRGPPFFPSKLGWEHAYDGHCNGGYRRPAGFIGQDWGK
jgi:hypothetical protein